MLLSALSHPDSQQTEEIKIYIFLSSSHMPDLSDVHVSPKPAGLFTPWLCFKVLRGLKNYQAVSWDVLFDARKGHCLSGREETSGLCCHHSYGISSHKHISVSLVVLLPWQYKASSRPQLMYLASFLNGFYSLFCLSCTTPSGEIACLRTEVLNLQLVHFILIIISALV